MNELTSPEGEPVTDVDPAPAWLKTACVLCSNNCGVEVRLDGRTISRVRGNKAHVASRGYTCEKALRLDHYQNARSRLTTPMERLDDGTYLAIDWDTAIAEVAQRLRAVGERHGPDKVMCRLFGTHTHGEFAQARTGGAVRRDVRDRTGVIRAAETNLSAMSDG